ncbi:Glutaconyl-CoA decarboxylase subunit gamma [Natranaerofaba carboxydovora]|nr:Glutaconyl-CoA decarboxylase subunit gamma [Natranaerofaba carboxydovora]
MPGTVLDIKVSEGDQIQAGQVVLVLEAMKMENEIKASGEGTVKEILVRKQDSVDSGDPLIVLE